jgi:hypothetical protein
MSSKGIYLDGVLHSGSEEYDLDFEKKLEDDRSVNKRAPTNDKKHLSTISPLIDHNVLNES